MLLETQPVLACRFYVGIATVTRRCHLRGLGPLAPPQVTPRFYSPKNRISGGAVWRVAKEEPRPLATTLHAVVFVVELTVRQAQAAAADTAVEFVAQRLHLCDAGVEFSAKEVGEVFPICFVGGAIFRQTLKGRTNFGDGEPHTLGDHHKAEAANVAAGVAALTGVGSVGENQPLVFVISDSRNSEPCSVGN